MKKSRRKNENIPNVTSKRQSFTEQFENYFTNTTNLIYTQITQAGKNVLLITH